MENLQKLALTATRNMRFYFDNAYKHSNNCFTIIRNSCNSAFYNNQSSQVKFIKDSDLLCTTGNTRQRQVEIANTSASANLIQRRMISTTNSNFSNIFNIQDENDFKERVLNNKKPVVVDFYAVWCGPCKILAPKLEQVMAGYEGKADFAKIDIDKQPDLAFDYSVQSVPTVVAFKNGKIVSKFIGLQDDDRIKKFVKDLVDK